MNSINVNNIIIGFEYSIYLRVSEKMVPVILGDDEIRLEVGVETKYMATYSSTDKKKITVSLNDSPEGVNVKETANGLEVKWTLTSMEIKPASLKDSGLV